MYGRGGPWETATWGGIRIFLDGEWVCRGRGSTFALIRNCQWRSAIWRNPPSSGSYRTDGGLRMEGAVSRQEAKGRIDLLRPAYGCGGKRREQIIRCDAYNCCALRFSMLRTLAAMAGISYVTQAIIPTPVEAAPRDKTYHTAARAPHPLDKSSVFVRLFLKYGDSCYRDTYIRQGNYFAEIRKSQKLHPLTL